MTQKQPISDEYCQWLADLKMAFSWTKTPHWDEFFELAREAGSKEALLDAEKYQGMIDQYKREKADVEFVASLEKAKELATRRQRWGGEGKFRK